MNEHMMEIKAAITLFFTGLGAFLGWKGVMALVWVTAMALDYISGSAAAMKEGQWSSAKARAGLWHKCGMILAIVAAGIADMIMGVILTNIPGLGATWPGMVLPLVLAWYIITELGSILENAIRLGANVPAWLVKLLKAGLKAVDTAGENTVGDEKE